MVENIIKNHSPGDDITIMNTIFDRGKDPKDDKYKEYLSIIYKDNQTNQKYVQELVNPVYDYYMIKEEYKQLHNRLFVSKDEVDMISVPHINLEKDIAKRTGLLDFYYKNMSNGNARANGQLHTHPDVFNSDMNIEDHYRLKFDKLYKNSIENRTSKSYIDIEVDTINMASDFPQPGECPINAITLILQEQRAVYTFLLRNKKNPQIEQFEDSVKDGSIFPEIHDFVVNAIGDIKMAEKYMVTDLKYNFLFYDEDNEIALIKDVFNAINSFKPDFVLAWNMSFDIPYIIERCKVLGYNPTDILCHSDFKHKVARYYIDDRNKSDFAERGDFAIISSYSTFLDQMIHFASRRKGQSKFLSFSLDFIGNAVAKVKKLDYKNITTNISELPYKSYKTFVFYNIMDVIVQQCINIVSGDIDYVFNRTILNNTRYSKAHRQSVYLTNRGVKEFYINGYIMGNNVNRYNTTRVSFPGAFVADPRKLNDYSRLRIYGSPINVFDNLDDFDYSSLYPSIIRQFNIAPYTQLGMLEIPNKVHENENQLRMEFWTRGGEFLENFQSHSWLEINTRWFNLANFTTLYHEVEEFFTNVMNPSNGLKYYEQSGLISPLIPTNNQLLCEGFIFNENMKPVDLTFKTPNVDEWRNITNDSSM